MREAVIYFLLRQHECLVLLFAFVVVVNGNTFDRRDNDVMMLAKQAATKGNL